jgi:hypothetical protein
MDGRLVEYVSGACETTVRPAIDPACFGFARANKLLRGLLVTISTIEVTCRSGSTASRAGKMRCRS